MATVRKSNFDWAGKPFWGLVQQNGPWATTVNDQKRASIKDIPTIGGGIGAGGRAHAGNANFEQVITPYQINATGPPPAPSEYAKRSVVMGPVDMKRATKMGSTKMKLTLGARLRMGSKMGNVKEEITTLDPGEIMQPVVVEGTDQFGSTHHIMEMPPLLSPSDIGSSTPAYINELATNLRSVVNNAGYGYDTDSHVTGYTNMFRKPESVYKFRDDSATSSKTSKTTSTSLGSMASMTNPVPDPVLTYYPIEIKSPEIVDTVMTPNLNMSKEFLKSIADYDKAQMERMQKKRDSFKEPTERPVGAPTGTGKKTALDGTFLAEEANKGLTDGKSKPMSEKAKGKRPAPIATSPTESKPSKPAFTKPTPPVFKFKPKEEIVSPKPARKPVPKPAPKTGKVGKKTKPFQIPATPGRINGVLKRYKDTIPKVWKETNTDAENFLIIDAAYKKYLKEKKDKKKK